SRMNVGQILETHLGWAARTLGFEAKTPVFQGASEDEIGALLRLAGVGWAQQALGISIAAPSFDLDDARQLIAAVDAIPLDGGPIPERGIGRSMDRLLGLPTTPKEVEDKLKELARYLVAAAEELSERGEEATLEEGFPAAAALKKAKGLDGLNAAIEEHVV